MMALQARGLSVRRGDIPVIENLTFHVPTGEALILSGRNGIGKTSVLRTIAGLQPAEAGEVDVDPDDLSYAAHADGLKGALTVSENLYFWASVYGQSDISEALDALNLSPLRSRLAARLSAGQRRRLGLARLIVSRRKVWLMDEPTVSLDKASVAMVQGILKKHLDQGGAALIATHLDMGINAPDLNLEAFRAGSAYSGGGFDAAEGFL